MTEATVLPAKTASEPAALWWVSALRDPWPYNYSKNTGVISLMDHGKETHTPPPEKAIELFASLLSTVIDHHLQSEDPNGINTPLGIILRVDYEPEGILGEVGRLAGVPDDILSWPWHTTMYVKSDSVVVAHSLHTGREVVWSKQD